MSEGKSKSSDSSKGSKNWGGPDCKCYGSAGVELLEVCPCLGMLKDPEEGWRKLRPGERAFIRKNDKRPVLLKVVK